MEQTARGREVSIRMVRDWIPGYERHGIQCDVLLEGLGFSRADFSDASRRISWEDLAEFHERLAKAAGSNQHLETLVGSAMETYPWMQFLAGSVVNLQQLYLVVAERILRKNFHNLGVRVELLPLGRVGIEMRIPDGYRPSVAFFHATLGCLQTMPRLLGLPHTRVEADISPQRAVFMVDPPSGDTLGLQAAPRPLQLVPDPLHGPEEFTGPDIMIDESDLVHSVVPLGQHLANQTHAESLGRLFTEFMQQRFCSRHVALFMKHHDACQQVWLNRDPDKPVELRVNRSLTMAGAEVGRIDVDLPAAALGERVPLFEAIIPWLSLGVANVLRSDTLTDVGESRTDSISSRLEELALQWKVTPKEKEVLQQLIAGATNKEIGDALGAAVKTVEFHVGNLLRKAGVESRSALIARLLGGRSPDR